MFCSLYEEVAWTQCFCLEMTFLILEEMTFFFLKRFVILHFFSLFCFVFSCPCKHEQPKSQNLLVLFMFFKQFKIILQPSHSVKTQMCSLSGNNAWSPPNATLSSVCTFSVSSSCKLRAFVWSVGPDWQPCHARWYAVSLISLLNCLQQREGQKVLVDKVQQRIPHISYQLLDRHSAFMSYKIQIASFHLVHSSSFWVKK